MTVPLTLSIGAAMTLSAVRSAAQSQTNAEKHLTGLHRLVMLPSQRDKRGKNAELSQE
jgi:hypothetical protein